jgi:hypothetical protein
MRERCNLDAWLFGIASDEVQAARDDRDGGVVHRSIMRP